MRHYYSRWQPLPRLGAYEHIDHGVYDAKASILLRRRARADRWGAHAEVERSWRGANREENATSPHEGGGGAEVTQ